MGVIRIHREGVMTGEIFQKKNIKKNSLLAKIREQEKKKMQEKAKWGGAVGGGQVGNGGGGNSVDRGRGRNSVGITRGGNSVGRAGGRDASVGRSRGGYVGPSGNVGSRGRNDGPGIVGEGLCCGGSA